MSLGIGSRTTIETVRLAWGGDTVGYLADGRVCFVRGAPVGMRVDVELIQSKKKFSRGRMLTEQPSPLCEDAVQCGGCPWHLSSSEIQRQALLAHTERQFRRLPWSDKGADISWGGLSATTGWRQTVRFHWRETSLGYYAWGTHDIIVPQACPIPMDELEEIRVLLVRFFERFGAGEGVVRLTFSPETTGCLISVQPNMAICRQIDWATFGQCLDGHCPRM